MANPGKPWYRPRNVLLALLLGLLAWIGYLVYWALTATAVPTVDYGKTLETLSADAQPPGTNGWSHIVAATEIMRRVEEDYSAETLDFALLYAGEPTPDQLSTLSMALVDLRGRGAFQELAAAGRCDNFVRPWPAMEEGWLMLATLPDLMLLRDLTRARVASMHLALEDGDDDEAVRAFDQTLIIARASAHQPAAIALLVGHAVARLVLDRVREQMVAREFDEALYRRFLDRLKERLPLGEVALALEGERCRLLDMIQRTHTDDGKGGGRLLVTAMAQLTQSRSGTGGSKSRPSILNVTGLLAVGRREITDAGNAFYDAVIAQSRMSQADREADPFDAPAYVKGLGRRYHVLGLMLTAIGRLVAQGDIQACVTNGTILHLAIEGFAAQNGRYPSTLDELVGDWLDEIPPDPYAPSGFVYRPVSGDPHGREYLLYSVGADGRDDGGTVGDGESIRALRSDARGLDFVLNQPRPEP